jgi:simple sugar transport system permease protein
VALLPLVNLGMALLVAGVVVALIGQNPLDVLSLLVQGAFGIARAASRTRSTTRPPSSSRASRWRSPHTAGSSTSAPRARRRWAAWARARSRCGSRSLPGGVMLPLMVVAAAAFGAAWAAVPAYLQAYRGSHIVITTIMFNFIAYTCWSTCW